LIERFHRSLQEEEIWLNEYRSLGEANESSLVGSASTITTALIGHSETELGAKPVQASQNLNHY
jgi:hypothetical protein